MANISGFSLEEYIDCAVAMNREEHVGIIEVNISCPNVHGGGLAFGADPKAATMVTRAVKESVSKPVYIKLSPSGIKSPIYCDNRLTLSYPKTREKIEKAFAQTIAEKFPQVDRLMGTSTAGIPHAAIAGYLLQLPMGYVRGSAKDHGRTNQIEGVLQKGIR